MGTRYILLFQLLLFLMPALLVAETTSNVIREVREKSKQSPGHEEELMQAAAAKLDAMDSEEVTEALYSEMDTIIHSVTVNSVVRHMTRFDINSWVRRLESETNPMIVFRGLVAGSCSKNRDSAALKEFAITMLGDRRVGERPQIEERPRERRVCDYAVKYLWSLEPEESWPAGYYGRNEDELIADYMTKFNITLLEKRPTPKALGHPPPSGSRSAKRPATTPEENREILENKSSSFAPWILIVVLAMSSGGLLWLLVKRRS